MKPRSKRISSISPSKRSSRAAYNREAKRLVWVARATGMGCPVIWHLHRFLVMPECIHHARGKDCEALRHDKRGWFLMTVEGNLWVHRNMAAARKQGWLCADGKWGTPFKPDDPPMPGSVADLQAKGLL